MASEAKATFTPGPWRVVDLTDGEKGLLGITDFGPAHICEIFPFGHRSGGIDRDLDEHRANARLIAAAPDLFAALTKALDLCEGFDDADMAEDGETPIVRPVIDACRAALAKAGAAP